MAAPATGAGEPPGPYPFGGLDTPTPPAGFAATPLLPDFAASPPVPDFSTTPDVSGPTAAPPASGFGPPQATEFPSRDQLGFAAAPVTADHPGLIPAEPTAEGGEPPPPGASDPSYIWDLAATDVFPAATAQTPETPETPPPSPEGDASGDGGN